MKKFVSLVLTIAMILSASTHAFASDVDSVMKKDDITSAAARMQKDLPDANIRVVDDVIHIVVDDLSSVPWLGNSVPANQSRAMTVYSSNGGSFRYFEIPSYGYLSYVPYVQVYMYKEYVDALKLKMVEPTFCQWVIDQIGSGATTASVVGLAYAVWGISISTTVAGLIGNSVYWVLSNLDYWSLKSAQEESSTGKVCVVRGTSPEGYASNIYSPWNNNTCTTYGGYDAVWYSGEYDIV